MNCIIPALFNAKDSLIHYHPILAFPLRSILQLECNLELRDKVMIDQQPQASTNAKEKFLQSLSIRCSPRSTFVSSHQNAKKTSTRRSCSMLEQEQITAIVSLRSCTEQLIRELEKLESSVPGGSRFEKLEAKSKRKEAASIFESW